MIENKSTKYYLSMQTIKISYFIIPSFQLLHCYSRTCHLIISNSYGIDDFFLVYL